jgi:hypothetical protein
VRDMLIDVVSKKLNEGHGEYVTLRRACLPAWPTGSLQSSPLKAVDSTGYCVVYGGCCPTAGSVHASCNMPHEVSPQQLL